MKEGNLPLVSEKSALTTIVLILTGYRMHDGSRWPAAEPQAWTVYICFPEPPRVWYTAVKEHVLKSGQ